MKRFVGMIINRGRAESKRGPYTPIASKYRLIDFPLSNMVNAGVKNVGIVMSDSSQKLAEHLGSGKDWGLERNVNGLFLLEGDYFTLQTHDLSNDLRDLLKNIEFLMNLKEEYVLVSGCNFIANIDYQSIFREKCMDKCDILMLYKKNTEVLQNVNKIVLDEKDGFKDIEFVTEPEAVENLFMETYFIRKEVLIGILRTANRSGILSMNQILGIIKDEVQISIHKYSDFAFYIDSPKRYFDANMAFLNQDIWQQVFNNGMRQIFTKNSDYPPTIYGHNAEVRNTLLTSGDQINGYIANSVIFRNVKIEKDAVVENCIIGDNCIIEERVCLKNIIIEPDCRISRDTTLISSVENPMVIS